MTRDLTAGMLTEITSPALTPIFLVKFSFDEGDVNFWSGIGALQWNGDIYVGTGHFGKFSPITETGLLKATSVTFTLSAVNQDILSLALAVNYQGRTARLWFGVLSSSFQLVADPYLLMAGKMDVMVIDDNPENAIINLTVENDLVDLRRVYERRYTPEDQKLQYPGDTFFDRVAGLQDANVIFGGTS